MTDASAIGYMIMAAEEAGLDGDAIKKLEHLMYKQMDLYTEEEAEQIYRNS